MKKITKYDRNAYTFEDVEGFEMIVSAPNKKMIRLDFPQDCYFFTTSEVQGLIEVLQEFVETGDLK